MKFAICNELFEGWEFEKVCRFAKGLGYGGVELAPFTLASDITAFSSNQRAEYRSIAEDVGIEILGLHWLLAKTEGLHLTTPDEATRQRTADYVIALAEACNELGGDIMVFGSPQQRSLVDGTTQDEAYERATEVFRKAMPRLEELGVFLCMEPLAPSETDFVQTCGDGRKLINAVQSSNFVLHQDVKAMSSESESIPQLIQDYADVTKHFHANDENLRGPGFGDVNFVPIFDALKRSNYGGWVSVEVFDYSPDPETIARESIEYMKRCLQQ